jgi:hypothetical protein
MTTAKGNGETGTRSSDRSRSNAVRSIFVLCCLPVVLTACVHWPDIATECESYGVSEGHQPMGNIVVAEPLYRDELESKCEGAEHATARINPDAKISGCAVSREDGIVHAYYWVGDRCAMNHELCHAMHGAGHTARYERELADGVTMPYCPSNQLNFPGMRG